MISGRPVKVVRERGWDGSSTILVRDPYFMHSVVTDE
jgi:hypothetical protein